MRFLLFGQALVLSVCAGPRTMRILLCPADAAGQPWNPQLKVIDEVLVPRVPHAACNSEDSSQGAGGKEKQ